MQKLNTKDLKIIDLTRMIIPPPPGWQIGPDEWSTRVKNESVIYPLETYPTAIDDTTYMMIKLKSHIGTHQEVPSHKFKNGKKLSDFPADAWLGRMVFFKFDLAPKTLITPEMVKKLDNGRLKENDIVIVHNSSSPKVEDILIRDDIPLLTTEAAAYFVEKKIKMYGFDNTVLFAPPINGGAHDLFLENNVNLLEWLINLDQLKQDVSFIIALPGLKIKGVDASPTWTVVLEGVEVV
jgi:arylformamidase